MTRRGIFNFTAVVSLLVCVWGILFAVRGIWRLDVADVHSPYRRIAIASAWGKLAVGATDGPCPLERQGWHRFTGTAWDEPRNLCGPATNEAILSYEFSHAGITYNAGWFPDPAANRHLPWAKDKIGQVLDFAPSYAIVRPIIGVAYIFLGAKEWGNELMAKIAADYFAASPSKADVVRVHEHGGWFLSFLSDGTIVETANDGAVLSERARQWLASVKGARTEIADEISR